MAEIKIKPPLGQLQRPIHLGLPLGGTTPEIDPWLVSDMFQIKIIIIFDMGICLAMKKVNRYFQKVVLPDLNVPAFEIAWTEATSLTNQFFGDIMVFSSFSAMRKGSLCFMFSLNPTKTISLSLMEISDCNE